jgi:hypothetical protein
MVVPLVITLLGASEAIVALYNHYGSTPGLVVAFLMD